MSNRKNALWHDLHDDDDIDRLMRERSSVDVSDPGPTPARSTPASGNVSDHYRMSSPNRNRGRDDGKMRHHRSR